MTQDDAFLQAILEAPDDDVPRLVYADWLEEHGDPRSTFLRVQCELARLAEDDLRREALRAQARPLEEQIRQALTQKVRPEWARKIPAWAVRALSFERGFPAVLTTTPAQFVKGAEALFRAVPVQHLKICSLRQALPQVLRVPQVERLRSLDLSWNRIGNAGAGTLAAARSLRNLTALNLHACKLRADGGVSLGSSQHLAGLTRLNLCANALYDKGVEGLTRSKHLWGLTDLDVGWFNNVGPRGAAALATSPRMVQLVRLKLDHNRLRERGATALGDGGLPVLRSLDVSFNNIGDAGAAALLTSTALPCLHTLNLAGNELTAAVWRVAPAAPLRDRLHLNLSQNPLADGAAMVDSALLAACVSLELNRCDLGDTEADALARSRGLTGLRSLHLAMNAITGEGLATLARSPYLGSLHSLSLAHNPLGSGGVEGLLDSQLAWQLTHLDLSCCQLPAIDGGRLAAAKSLESLVELRLRGNPRLDLARQRLVDRFGPRVVLN
jgi:uncharacterized protein (TIGR02996 family)